MHMMSTRAREIFLGKLSSILGVDEQKLGQSFKEAAKQTVDQGVQSGYLTQQQAEHIKDRIEHGKRGFFDRSWAFMVRMHRQTDAMFEAVASKLGMSLDDLENKLEAGKSLSDLAREKGVSEDDLRKTVMGVIQPRLDQAVKGGKITS
ncbi:MAG: hypothetical protein ACRDIY_20695, partial [Chloroflexota bacterium]